MDRLKTKLKQVSKDLKNGVEPKTISVRELIELGGATRRGRNVNARIKSYLEDAGIATNPNFETTYINNHIKFVKNEALSNLDDYYLTHKIGSLESANRKPVSVKPDSLVNEAVSIMMTNDYSQLPVMTTDREVKGTLSWRSIGYRLTQDISCSKASDCMDMAHIVNSDATLFDAIGIISLHDYVLVMGQDKSITGIVTATDLSLQFRDLAEPFILIGEIENLLRMLIHGKFNVEELESVRHSEDSSREVSGVSDLTLGEYVILLENEERWNKLQIKIDRVVFRRKLNEVREIRNDVMHFDPQGIDPLAITKLHDFVRFLKNLNRIGVF